MPTYEALRAERPRGIAVWNREIVTPEMTHAISLMANGLNLPVNRFGTRGDNKHVYGSHRSQEWIELSRFCTSRSNTWQAGLSSEQRRHIAGIDIGPFKKEQLLFICRNLDKAVRSGNFEEIRAFYGNINGDSRVDGYNNIENRLASADLSHLTHAHLTLDRRIVGHGPSMLKVVHAVLGKGLPSTTSVPESEDLTPIEHLLLRQNNQLLFAIIAGTDAKVSPDLGTSLVTVPNNLAKGVRAADDSAEIAALKAATAPVTVEQNAGAEAQRLADNS